MIALLIFQLCALLGDEGGASGTHRCVAGGAGRLRDCAQDALDDPERAIEEAVVSSFQLADDSMRARISTQLISEFRRVASGLPQDKIAEFLSQMTKEIRVVGATVSATGTMDCPAWKRTKHPLDVWASLPDHDAFMSEHDKIVNELNLAGSQYLSGLMNAAGMVRSVGSEVEKRLTEQFALLGRFLKDEIKPFIRCQDERIEATLAAILEHETEAVLDPLIRRHWGVEGLFEVLTEPLSDDQILRVVSAVRRQLAVKAKECVVEGLTDDVEKNMDIFDEATGGVFRRILSTTLHDSVCEVGTARPIREVIDRLVRQRKELEEKAKRHGNEESTRYFEALRILEAKNPRGDKGITTKPNSNSPNKGPTKDTTNAKPLNTARDVPRQAAAPSTSDPLPLLLVVALVGLCLGSVVTMLVSRLRKR